MYGLRIGTQTLQTGSCDNDLVENVIGSVAEALDDYANLDAFLASVTEDTTLEDLEAEL